jgi:hypothetical protein
MLTFHSRQKDFVERQDSKQTLYDQIQNPSEICFLFGYSQQYVKNNEIDTDSGWMTEKARFVSICWRLDAHAGYADWLSRPINLHPLDQLWYKKL